MVTGLASESADVADVRAAVQRELAGKTQGDTLEVLDPRKGRPSEGAKAVACLVLLHDGAYAMQLSHKGFQTRVPLKGVTRETSARDTLELANAFADEWAKVRDAKARKAPVRR